MRRQVPPVTDSDDKPRPYTRNAIMPGFLCYCYSCLRVFTRHLLHGSQLTFFHATLLRPLQPSAVLGAFYVHASGPAALLATHAYRAPSPCSAPLPPHACAIRRVLSDGRTCSPATVAPASARAVPPPAAALSIAACVL